MLTGRSAARRPVAALTGVALGIIAAFAVPTPAVAAPDTPLTAADKNLLSAVHLAGLWEIPAGDLAARKGGRARVRQVGAEIANQYARLDGLVVDAARRVRYRLPDEPSAQQRTWLAELEEAKPGAEFDQIFVDRLRAAYGAVFSVIAEVRSGTRNDVVRRLAQDANGFVLDHLTLLESTDLVRFSARPEPSYPGLSSPSPDRGWLGNAVATGARGGENVPPIAIWIVVVVVLAAGGAAARKMFRR